MLFRRLSRALINFSKSSVALAALITFLIFSAIFLPGQSAAAAVYSGSSGLPDLSLFYSSNDLYHMAEQYGSTGRDAYVHARFSFDLIFPIIYTLFLITAISWILRTITLESSSWRNLNLVPILGMLFDFLENITASIVVNRYPVLSPISANLAPTFTFLKWAFVGSSFLILCASGLILLFTQKRTE